MTKRTRHRGRTKPKVEVEPADQTQLDLAELAALWPRLESALGRDSGGQSSESTGSGSGAALGSPAVINLDVQHAQTEIGVGAEKILTEVERLLGLERRSRSTASILAAMPDWYQQLRDRGQPLAKRITAEVERWRRSARGALRMRTREDGIGWICPNHRDRPTELVREGDEAILHPAVIAGHHPPRGEAPMRWRHSESVRCPRCKERWQGATQLRTLMRMIQAAERQETEQ